MASRNAFVSLAPPWMIKERPAVLTMSAPRLWAFSLSYLLDDF